MPHGHAVAVCLPEIWEYMIGNMEKCLDKRGKDYLDIVFNRIAKSMGCDSPQKAIEKFRKVMIEMNLECPVAGNKEDELKVLTLSVNPVRLKNNPVKLEEEKIKEIYSIILH